VTFYQFNPTFDELSYDTAMYNTLVSAGFPSSKRFLSNTRVTAGVRRIRRTITTVHGRDHLMSYDNKIDKRAVPRWTWLQPEQRGHRRSGRPTSHRHLRHRSRRSCGSSAGRVMTATTPLHRTPTVTRTSTLNST